MHQRIVFLLLIAMVFTGCSSVRTVSPDENAQTSYADVNRAVRGKVVKISFREGRQISVTGLRVMADSLVWVDLRGNKLQSAKLADVEEISIVKAGRGALVGLVTGAVAGAGVGVARAFMQGDDPESDPIGITQEQKLHTFPLAHAFYGALVSTPVGAIIGGRKTYRFEPVSLPDQTLTQKK